MLSLFAAPCLRSLVAAVILVGAGVSCSDSGGSSGSEADTDANAPTDVSDSEGPEVEPLDGDTSGEEGADEVIEPVGCESDSACAAELVGQLSTCTTAICNDETGECEVADIAEGTLCDDGDPCTLLDRCKSGACVSESIDCDDGNPCTTDACVNGVCAFEPNANPCNDGNTCTVGDQCADGLCAGGDNQCPCDEARDCVPFEDGDLCNGTLVCFGGLCIIDPTTIPNCPSISETCTFGGCNSETGDCDLTILDDGVPCDDGDACSDGETCSAGDCIAPPGEGCDDGNPCTVDACDADLDACINAPAPTIPCDDGDSCTNGDTCKDGACSGIPIGNCDDANPCTDDICSDGGGCVYVPTEGECEDGNLCTEGETCQSGLCIGGIPKDCNDSNPCTTEVCNQALGCVSDTQPNGAPCNDGDPCTLGESCTDGECVPETSLNCNDDNPCTVDACDVLSSTCSNMPLANGELCDDGDECTIGDSCVEGQCEGGELVCDPCEVGPDWGACDDGDPLTFGDVCFGGACAGFLRYFGNFDFGSDFERSAFTAVVAEGISVVATGFTIDGEAGVISWGAELKGPTPPTVATSSLVAGSAYRALAGGLAVGDDGLIASFSGPLWDTTPNVADQLATLAPVEQIEDIWSANLKNTANDKLDIWFLMGRTSSDAPWVARCERQSAGFSSFTWDCDQEFGFTNIIGPIRAGAGWVGPCDEPGCVGLTLKGFRVFADAFNGDSSYVVDLKDGSWITAGDVDGVLGDRWVAADSLGDSTWGLGTDGLMTVFDGATWPSLALGGGPDPAEVDYTAVEIIGEHVFAVGRRLYSAFGTNAVDLYLMSWPVDGDVATDAEWVKIGTNFCEEAACSGDVGAAPQSLTGIAMGGFGPNQGLYLVGREYVGGVEQAVIYFRPTPPLPMP